MDRGPPGGPRDVDSARDRPPAASRAWPAGRPTDSDDVPTLPTHPSASTEAPERDPVLDEIDRILLDVRSRRVGESSPVNSVESDAPKPSNPVRSEPTGNEDNGDAPSGYFEEHLADARLGVESLDKEIARLETSSRKLRHQVPAIESNLDRITGEYLFLRGRGWMETPVVRVGGSHPIWDEDVANEEQEAESTVAAAGSTGSPTGSQTGPSSASSAVYREFTVGRYNRAIDSLKVRRARLVTTTLLLSAAVGTLLVTLVLYSPIENPPLWIAALPLVWVIPIPFFLLAFRGTHRVLERNHLNLPEVE